MEVRLKLWINNKLQFVAVIKREENEILLVTGENL